MIKLKLNLSYLKRGHKGYLSTNHYGPRELYNRVFSAKVLEDHQPRIGSSFNSYIGLLKR